MKLFLTLAIFLATSQSFAAIYCESADGGIKITSHRIYDSELYHSPFTYFSITKDNDPISTLLPEILFNDGFLLNEARDLVYKGRWWGGDLYNRRIYKAKFRLTVPRNLPSKSSFSYEPKGTDKSETIEIYCRKI